MSEAEELEQAVRQGRMVNERNELLAKVRAQIEAKAERSSDGNESESQRAF